MIKRTVIYFMSQNYQGVPIPMYKNHNGWTEYIENAKLFDTDKLAIEEIASFTDSTFYMIKNIYYNG